MAGEIESLIRVQQPAALSAALYTIGLDGQRAVCLRWQGPFPSIDDLNEAVEERALRQANALGGVHNFCFEMYDPSGASLGSEFFRVSAENFSGDRSMLSEPANEGGVLAQQMRITEALARLQVQGAEKQNNILHKMLETMGRRAENAEQRYLQGLEVFVQAITGERQAEVEAIRADGNARAKLAIANRVGTLLGPLAAGFLKKQLPGSAGAAAGASVNMQSLASSLTTEQMEAIMQALTPEQNAALFAILAPLKAEQEKHDVPEPRARKANGDATH